MRSVTEMTEEEIDELAVDITEDIFGPLKDSGDHAELQDISEDAEVNEDESESSIKKKRGRPKGSTVKSKDDTKGFREDEEKEFFPEQPKQKDKSKTVVIKPSSKFFIPLRVRQQLESDLVVIDREIEELETTRKEIVSYLQEAE